MNLQQTICDYAKLKSKVMAALLAIDSNMAGNYWLRNNIYFDVGDYHRPLGFNQCQLELEYSSDDGLVVAHCTFGDDTYYIGLPGKAIFYTTDFVRDLEKNTTQ